MAAPRYFQTEDEKRMAAIRANPSGRPVQMVRPMRPAGSDSREKWRENVPGGKMIGIDQYKENNRKMYTMENVPTAPQKWQPAPSTKRLAAKRNYDATLMTPAEIEQKDYNKREQENYRIEQQYGSDKGQARYLSQIREQARSSFTPDQAKMSGVLTPHNAPGSYSGEGSQSNAPQWQQNLTKQYPELGIEGSSANDKFNSEFTSSMSKAEVDELAERAMGNFSSRPQQDIPKLPPLIAKTDPYATMLNDRPEGGRTYESPFSKPRPMGSGTLSQRPTSTASGAAERVAYRRAIRMDPKSIEEDRRWARGIGGARNPSYGNYD